MQSYCWDLRFFRKSERHEALIQPEANCAVAIVAVSLL